MALILLCAVVSCTAWCLLLDSLALLGAGSCQNQLCGCMNTLPVDDPPAMLYLYCLNISPFSLDLALTGAWIQNPQPFSPFPHAKPAGALGQCASPSWTCRPHRGTQGTSNLPGCIINFWCSQGLAESVCVSPRGGKNGDPLNCSSFTLRSFTPAWGGHNPASNQHWGAPQLSFLQLLAAAGP